MGDCDRQKGKHIWHWTDGGVGRTEPLPETRCDCQKLTWKEFKEWGG